MITAIPTSSPAVAEPGRIPFRAMAMIATRMVIATWNSLIQVRFYRLQEFRADEDRQEVSEEVEELIAIQPIGRDLEHSHDRHPPRFEECEK